MSSGEILPIYVGIDKISIKKYKNIYKSIVYNKEPYKTLLQKLSIDTDKLSKDNELYFGGYNNDSSANNTTYYILSYVVYIVKGIYLDNEVKIIDVIATFDRNDINTGIKILEENSRKYSMLSLIDMAVTFKPKRTSFNDIIQSIYQCPKGYYFSLDLMINMKRSFSDNDSNGRYISKIIPLVSSNEVMFEYIHIELFGVTHSQIIERLANHSWDQFLCVDNGKKIPFNKKSLYRYVNTNIMIVSKRQNDTLFKHCIKYILDYLPASFNEVKVVTQTITEVVEKKAVVRKAIPKSLKSKLWKQYFGNNLIGKCYCCGAELEGLASWEAGHILAAANGGPDTIENLRPVCSTCNKSMGATHMDIFKEKFFK